jgi:hypothetical protein
MKLFYKITLLILTISLLLILGLLPVWLTVEAENAEVTTDQLPLRPGLIDASAVITFTPVATLYLSLVLRAEEEVSPVPGTGEVKIGHIEYNPDGSDAEGEYVDLQNLGTATVDITGWTLRDEADTVFTFPSFSLASLAQVRVWVKPGVDDATNLYWGRNSAIWNNTGDTATLRDATGNEVDQCTYPGGTPGFYDCLP